MEIELPDGTVLEAPDDADIKTVVQNYRRQQAIANAPKEEYSPVEKIQAPVYMRGPQGGVKTMEMTDPSLENFRASVGSGMLRTAKGLTNLVLPDSLTPEWASDENIQEMDKRDEPLLGTGKMLGSIAASAPISELTGLGLGAGANAAGGGIFTRTLSSPWTRAAVEGGLQGAIYADPKKQGEGALLGAGIGTVLRGATGAAGRLTRGLIEKSEAAKALEQLAAQHGEEIFAPISQVASEEGIGGRLAKAFYKEALPIVPGVRGKLIRQSEEAADKLRELAMREGLPPGASLPPEATKNPLLATKQMQADFDRAYDETIKSYAFNVPKDFKSQVVQAYRAKVGGKTTPNRESLTNVSEKVDEILAKFSDGKGSIDGANLLNAKREIGDLISQAPGHEKAGYQAADELLDNLVESELKVGNIPQNLADLQRYKDLTPAYRAFRPVREAAAANKAKKGKFFFRTLAEKSGRSPEQLDLGQIGTEVLDRSPVTSGITGKILAGIGTGGAGYGVYMNPVAGTSAILGGNLLATRQAQRVLLGNTKMQKAIAEALRRNPELAAKMEAAARAGLISDLEGEENARGY